MALKGGSAVQETPPKLEREKTDETAYTGQFGSSGRPQDAPPHDGGGVNLDWKAQGVRTEQTALLLLLLLLLP